MATASMSLLTGVVEAVFLVLIFFQPFSKFFLAAFSMILGF